MEQETVSITKRTHRSEHLPSYVFHPDFAGKKAAHLYSAAAVTNKTSEYADHYMPDDVTRDHARRMHYAAYRMHHAKSPRELARWQADYLAIRDRIVLGNRKLIYRAVRRRMTSTNRADDMIGECHIVLIQAVAAYNPWLGIRFSTYAYTCLVRALSRLSQRLATDWISQSLSLDLLPNGEPRGRIAAESSSHSQIRLDEFLREDHPLLSFREKAIISRRFCLGDENNGQTLEKVGKSLGLSKERVRQVQASALEKLRKALAGSGPQRDTPQASSERVE